MFRPLTLFLKVGGIAALLIGTGLGLARLNAQQAIQIELVSLRAGGFSPAKITRPRGKFLLIIKNRSQADQMTLGITHSSGLVAVAAAVVHDHNQDYVLDLQPGTYTLSDSAHPGWTSLSITIQ